MDPERKAFINSLLEHYQPKDAQDIQDIVFVRWWELFSKLKMSLWYVSVMQEKSLSTDGGFSFSGSIQEVIKFCE